jgi:hypothetical protein
MSSRTSTSEEADFLTAALEKKSGQYECFVVRTTAKTIN